MAAAHSPAPAAPRETARCAIIAATALAHGLTLVSRNGKDFAGLAGLVVLNPHEAGTLM